MSMDSVDTLPSKGSEENSSQQSFFELQAPASTMGHVKVEDVMERLFSREHLHFILADHALFYKFSSFLNRYKSQMVPALIRYLEMRKAITAIEYANTVAQSVRWPSHTDYCKFSRVQAGVTDVRFEDYAHRELMLLCSEALPAFITHSLVGVVTDCVSKDIAGQSIPVVHNLLGHLAEVFCLTDPSVHDNPIIFASEEFHKTTQYGTSYAIDRNCRFLQGPGTDKDCTLRIAKAVSLGQESNEILLNYRRDGTPFVNLLMCAPLYDDKGVVRYFIGAQVDVTGLVIDGLGIESFQAFLHSDREKEVKMQNKARVMPLSGKNQWLEGKIKERHAKLRELSLMFSQDESDVVGQNIRGGDDNSDNGTSIKSGVPTNAKNRGQVKRIIDEIGDPLLGQPSIAMLNRYQTNTSLPGVYQHYLLVRPYPSLQIIFVSPTLRLPGILRTHLFSKIGGPANTIAALESAFQDGASVTAKVLWLPKNSHTHDRGCPPSNPKPRFMRCTPLLGSDDRVGVWMVILVPAEEPVGFPQVYGGTKGGQGMVDELAGERKRFGDMSRSLNRRPSLDGWVDGDEGARPKDSAPRLRKEQSMTPMKGEMVDDQSQLYAGYLRGSSSTGNIMEGQVKAGEREKGGVKSDSPMRNRSDSAVADMGEQDDANSNFGSLRRKAEKDDDNNEEKDSSTPESRVPLLKRSNSRIPGQGPLNSCPVVRT